jgi:predicted flap endonuclease-1-like 5' DNA nuclease
MGKITEIEGIGEVSAARLSEGGVVTTEKLLEVAAGKKGRQELAAGTGLSEVNILKWVNRADLCRIKGVGGEFSDLLEYAGVDTVPELAQRNAANLHATMLEVNAARNLVRSPPSAKQVEEWVAQAKALPRVVTH